MYGWKKKADTFYCIVKCFNLSLFFLFLSLYVLVIDNLLLIIFTQHLVPFAIVIMGLDSISL